METANETRQLVRRKYGEMAEAGSGCCGGEGRASCCGPTSEAVGYTPEQLAALPEGADLGLGCGNPLAYAAVRPGETVLDLGSGAGIDAFLAAREVGPSGRVIGVDMTPAMIERARRNSAAAGVRNVEFRLGEIERLPVADAEVDVVISNCVINLSPEKAQVFREALRVLRPGGRLLVSDLVSLAEPAEEIRQSAEALVGCVAGASLRDDYLELMRGAGFQDVEVVAQGTYGSAGGCCPAPGSEAVASVKVRARK